MFVTKLTDGVVQYYRIGSSDPTGCPEFDPIVALVLPEGWYRFQDDCWYGAFSTLEAAVAPAA